MVEYRSWFPQDPVRSQIINAVLNALWEDPADPAREALSYYIQSFVTQRSRNFRDVISRVCKRTKESAYGKTKSITETTD